MIIGEIGQRFTSSLEIDYTSHRTFLERDLLILDMDIIFHKASNSNLVFLQKRRDQLLEFVKFKQMPVIYLAPFEESCLTIENGKMARVPAQFITSTPSFSLAKENGSFIEVVPNTIFTDFLSKYKKHFKYSGYFSNVQAQTIAETLHTKKVLAFYNKDSVILPRFELDAEEEDEFFKDLLAAAKSISTGEMQVQLPGWADQFNLPGESELKNEIIEIDNQIAELIEGRRIKEAQKVGLEKQKCIFTASGSILEQEVKWIFETLGFSILESEANRDDLIIQYGEKVAVVEIKGVGKSAAEKHAAQLEKWSANYYEKHGVEPKAILIVNAYRELPIDERVEDTFPNQMLPYSTKKEHCLLTTVQLMNLYYLVTTQEMQIDEMVNLIFRTNGVLQNHHEWNQFIRKD